MGDAAAALKQNGTFAGFTVRELLGKGGMADVYLAERTNAAGARERFALKVILPSFLDDPERRALFAREVRIAATLRHPNVVRVVEHGEIDDVPYLVLEHVDGLDLRTLVNRLGADAQKHGPKYAGQDRGALLPPMAVWIGIGAARGLHAAHTQASDDGRLVGIVHRDIAPGNLFIDVHGVVRVADFGVSKPIHAATEAISTTAAARGRTFYMAPELVHTKPDRRSDLFSIGVVLFELLAGAGRHPCEDPRYPHQDPIGLMVRAGRGERAFTMAEALPGMPARLHTLLEQLVHADPAQRPPSAEIVALELEAILREMGSDPRRASGLSCEILRLVHEPSEANTDREPAQPYASGVRPRTEDPVPTNETVAGHAFDLAEPDTNAAPFEAKEGAHLGPYRLLYQLGEGGMGVTWRAKRDDLGKAACVKIILARHAADPGYRKRFDEEAKMAASVSHPNVVSVFDFGQHADGTLWAGYDYIAGTDLLSMARKFNALPRPEEVALIAHDCAAGLLHLHTPDHQRPAIVHRDISKTNIMITHLGVAVIIDLGVAKAITNDRTVTDVIVGKLPYMAPEVLAQEEPGPPVDQWALGVVLYWLLTGAMPYKGAYDGSPLPPLVKGPHGPIDPRWAAIVGRLLQPKPRDRYPTLAEMIDELAPLLPPPSARRQLGASLKRRAPTPSMSGTNGMPGAAPKAEPILPPQITTVELSSPKPEPSAAATAPAPNPTPERPRRIDVGAMQPGDRLGEWEIEGKLGTGGMAVVYRASRTKLGTTQHAALKLIRPEHAEAPDFVERFHDEARIALRLNHPNIVTVLDAGEVSGLYFIAMELVEGTDLDALLKNLADRGILAARRLPPYLVVFIGYEMARALAYAHARGVVHRDVSPHNLLVTVDGAIKLNDWGVSKAMTTADGKVTGTQHAIGKPYYMPPEQFRGDALDGRADLFSGGGTLFELLAGETPYAIRGNARENIHMLIQRVFTNDRPHTAEIAPDAPSALIETVEHLLQPTLEPSAPGHPHRMRSADELVERLEPLVQLHATRHLAELVRTARDERYSPTPTLLDALRAVNAHAPGKTRTLELPQASSTPSAPTLDASPRSRSLLVAVLALALVAVGLITLATVMFWPSNGGPSETPAASRPERAAPPLPRTAEPSSEPAASARAEHVESNAPTLAAPAPTAATPSTQAPPDEQGAGVIPTAQATSSANERPTRTRPRARQTPAPARSPEVPSTVPRRRAGGFADGVVF